MDLQDFNGGALYFDQPEPARVGELLREAAQRYAQGDAEKFLLEAYALAPLNLGVLVGLYRFYYYQHRLTDAVAIAHKAMRAVAPQIYFPENWRELSMRVLEHGVLEAMGLVRFYLLALKGAGYLNLRLGEFEEGIAMLRKVRELDAADRLGAKLLLDVLAHHTADVVPFTSRKNSEVRV